MAGAAIADPQLYTQFFDRRYADQEFGDVTDGKRDWYRAFFEDTIVHSLFSRPITAGLELGCGTGVLRRSLGSSVGQVTYVGVDPSTAAIQIATRNATVGELFICSSIEDLPPLLPPGLPPFDCVLLLNVLPYVPNLNRALLCLSRLPLRDDCLLFLMEPSRSPYWERTFDGFSITLRSKDKIVADFQRHGWALAEARTLANVAFAGLAINPIATSFVFKRSGPHSVGGAVA